MDEQLAEHEMHLGDVPTALAIVQRDELASNVGLIFAKAAVLTGWTS
jgi:hypothetical protein